MVQVSERLPRGALNKASTAVAHICMLKICEGAGPAVCAGEKILHTTEALQARGVAR
jgi:hypothetical protein